MILNSGFDNIFWSIAVLFFRKILKAVNVALWLNIPEWRICAGDGQSALLLRMAGSTSNLDGRNLLEIRLQMWLLLLMDFHDDLGLNRLYFIVKFSSVNFSKSGCHACYLFFEG